MVAELSQTNEVGHARPSAYCPPEAVDCESGPRVSSAQSGSHCVSLGNSGSARSSSFTESPRSPLETRKATRDAPSTQIEMTLGPFGQDECPVAELESEGPQLWFPLLDHVGFAQEIARLQVVIAKSYILRTRRNGGRIDERTQSLHLIFAA